MNWDRPEWDEEVRAYAAERHEGMQRHGSGSFLEEPGTCEVCGKSGQVFVERRAIGRELVRAWCAPCTAIIDRMQYPGGAALIDRWTDLFGEELAGKLRDARDRKIEADHADTYYRDTWRVAPVDEPDARLDAIYEYVRLGGCCGSVDTTIEVDGSTWRLGFNWGH